MTTKLNRILLLDEAGIAELGQGGGGGAPSGSDVFDDNPQAIPGQRIDRQVQLPDDGRGTGGQGGGNEPSSPSKSIAPQTPTAPSVADIAQALKEAGFQAPAAAPQQPQPAPQYTQEQLDEMFKVWKPSKDIWSALRGEDEAAAIQALTTLRDGLMAQAQAAAQYYMELAKRELREKDLGDLEDVRGFISEQRAQALTDAFYKSFPDLDDDKYREVVDMVTGKLSESGWKGKDIKEVHAKINEVTLATLKQLGITPEKANGSQRGGNASRSRMSTLAGGGQSGGRGGSGNGRPSGPPGIEVFD